MYSSWLSGVLMMTMAAMACVPPPPIGLPPPSGDAGPGMDAGDGDACRPVTSAGADGGTGYVICGDSERSYEPVHRVDAVACSDDGPASRRACEPEDLVGAESVPAPFVDCATDADCTDAARGRCRPYPMGGCFCGPSRCTSDDECGDGYACGCNEASWSASRTDPDAFDPNRIDTDDVCLPAECRTEGDCGGLPCMLSPDYQFCGLDALHSGLFCATDEDECRSDADCGDAPFVDCAFDGSKTRWRCVLVHYDCWA